LVRAPACHAGGRGFESRRSRSREALLTRGFSCVGLDLQAVWPRVE
jgi:hypothetical protein